ncbi:protein of unknown function [Lachnospiraceae bacterium NK3A20]|nr:protein of unknown function [Lachnospiraceae bacterium NK3A20]
MKDIRTLEEEFHKLLSDFRYIHAEDIPDIDLYMDQVTTFMDQRLSPYARDPGNDKILTKTMINNYAKNDLLIPPVRKKYGRDHMILLLLIYYMKSFLSIGDIEEILRPIREDYTKIGREQKAEKEKRENKKAAPRGQATDPGTDAAKGQGEAPSPELQEIYGELVRELEEQLERIGEETDEDFRAAAASFADYPEKDREQLQQFDLILRMSAEIYLKKLFIERLIGEMKENQESI